MMEFSYYMPTKIHFGCGQWKRAAQYIAPLGRRILLITGKNAMKRQGYTDELMNSLLEAGVQAALFDGISANPLTREVNACVNTFLAWKPEVVVALGGGSVIDAAKGIVIGLTTGEAIEPFLFGEKAIPAVNIPIAAIPTTAGTGSETDRVALLTDEVKALKTSFRHDSLFPRIAIVDPMLTLSLPEDVTRETGFDVLAHAVETYISKAAGPLVEANSLEAIRLVRENLPKVLADGANITARTSMLYASMLMGFNLANSTTCLPHRLQYPVGIWTNTSHGAGLIALFPSWLACAYEFAADKFDKVATALAGKPCQGKADFFAAYEAFVRENGLTYTLHDFGLTAQDAEALTAKVAGQVVNDPAGHIAGIVQRVYGGALTA